MKTEMLKEGKKKVIVGALAGAMVFSSFGISVLTAEAADVSGTDSKVVLYEKDTQLAAMAAKAAETKTYTDYTAGDYQKVTLNGGSITFDGTGLRSAGSNLLINAAGTYVISGTLNNGAIIVDSADEANVTLVLNNADITCKNGAPIYVKNCGKNVIISLPNGTANTVTDGSSYTYEYAAKETDSETGEVSTEPSAAIFSKDDLKINGSGTLTVNANYNDGITGKDDVEITEATLVIQAADDGIVGKDSVVIGSGSVTIKAGGDGIKSTNSEDATKGYIAIADGAFNITSGNDGIQAESILLTLGGDYTIKTGEGAAAAKAKTSQDNMRMPQGNMQMPQGTTQGGMQMPQGTTQSGMQMPQGGFQGMQPPQNTSDSAIRPERIRPDAVSGATQKTGQDAASSGTNKTTKAAITGTATTAAAVTETETESAKALKAGTKVVIQDGTFKIDSEDDAIHSNDSVAVASGDFELATGDDGIHADNTLDIYSGDINITKSYEGLESTEMNLNGGTIRIVASDDGINISGGNDNSGLRGAWGMNATQTASTSTAAASAASTSEASSKLTISGGKINVNAGGDGIDVNGSGYMTGGTVAVSGPTDNGNAGLDYDGVFEVTGGTLIVAGSSGMAQAPSSGTTVNTIATAVATQAAGTELKLVSSSGTTVMSFTPEKQFSHIVISSPLIQKGSTYKLMAGSTELASFTAGSIVTNLSGDGFSGGMMNQGGRQNMQNGQNN